MAADVSRKIKSESNKPGLITRDFLGGCLEIESKELDLDLHVPCGWEKRLDLKSGKVYIQRCDPADSTFNQRNFAKPICPKFQDLNSIPQSKPSNSKPTLGLLEQPSLDLKLVSNNSPPAYTSVCTLDKVKSALDRAQRASPSPSQSSPKKRWMMPPSAVQLQSRSSPSQSNSSSLSFKEMDEEDERASSRWSSLPSDQNGLLVAAACPVCLLYVLISKGDPKCPKCNSVVHLPVMSKKPKIDLNISI